MMKRYIFSILVFFFIVAALDFCFGKAMDYMYFHSKGGKEKEMNDVCINNQYDVIVMGSSRAHHHYDPEIITDSLGMACYNTGKDGNGIIFMYGIYQMILERYTPKLIIYELSKGFDIYVNPEDQNNTRYVSGLKPYVKEPHIDEIFKSLSWQEWYKTYSNFYRYNSTSFDVVRNYLIQRPYNIDGYAALNGVMQYEPDALDTEGSDEIDSLKIEYFMKFIISTKSNNIKLICMMSPRYRSGTSKSYDTLLKLCDEFNVPVINYYNDTTFCFNRDYFKDASHMNKLGARAYTQCIANDIKRVIEK